MKTIIIFVFLISAIYAFFKYFFFRPKTNIFYPVKMFDAVYRTIAIVGRDDDSFPLAFIIAGIEKVEPFKFRFSKLVSKKEAEKNEWPIIFELKRDEKVIVSREEMIPGWRAEEVFAIGTEFITQDGVDMSMITECTYAPLPGDGPVLMHTKAKNWGAIGEAQIGAMLNAWGRLRKTYNEALSATIDEIMATTAQDVLKKSPFADPGETVREYLNEIFRPFGFELKMITLYKIVNGPQSQDVIDQREAILKADLQYQEERNKAKATYMKGLPAVMLEKKSLNNRAAYTERVNKSVNQTAIKVAEKLTKLQTLVISPDTFNTGAFTGSKVANQQQKGGDNNG